MLKKILIGVLIFIIGVIVGALLVYFCRNMMLAIPPKVVDYNKESQKRIEEENQRLKEKKQLPANMMSVNTSGELSKDTQNEIEAINKKREQSIKETLEQAEKVLNIMRKYKNKELEDFYKLVGTRDLTKVDVEYAPKFNKIVFDMYRYSNITKEEKAILKEYLADGLDSYNYQTNPKLLEEIEKELNIK
ncbi:MAG: hypothetical protein HXK67_02890 [Clostridiales bacterium]|jgi:hypothetical protein|nr:hypothetical protein [Clostridiales bacterium]